MKMKTNAFTHAIANYEKQIGVWVSLCSPLAAEVTANAGFDWAVIDMEHSPNDYLSILSQMQAFDASATTAIVRPEWNDPVAVKRLLDLGVRGLLFPMIQTVEEAKIAVESTRYPPHGNRGFAGGTRANKFGRVTDYLDRVDAETTVILQVETAAAIEIAVDIGSVDGVSGIFFGPADIAADIGKLGKPLDPAVWDLVKPAARKLIDKGIPVGTLVMDADFAHELLDFGFTFVACATDSGLLAKATDNLVAAMKK